MTPDFPTRRGFRGGQRNGYTCTHRKIPDRGIKKRTHLWQFLPFLIICFLSMSNHIKKITTELAGRRAHSATRRRAFGTDAKAAGDSYTRTAARHLRHSCSPVAQADRPVRRDTRAASAALFLFAPSTRNTQKSSSHVFNPIVYCTHTHKTRSPFRSLPVFSFSFLSPAQSFSCALIERDPRAGARLICFSRRRAPPGGAPGKVNVYAKPPLSPIKGGGQGSVENDEF